MLTLEPIILAKDMEHSLAKVRSHVLPFGQCLFSERENVMGNKENLVIILTHSGCYIPTYLGQGHSQCFSSQCYVANLVTYVSQ